MPNSTPEVSPSAKVAGLSIWTGPVAPVRLGGGITNVNFIVDDRGSRYVVRVGDDIPVHQIMRFNEQAASRAAFAAGVSPQLVHAEPGILVLDFIDGLTCSPADIRDAERLSRILPLVKRVHVEMPRHLRGPVLAFWVFHVIRDYAHTLRDGGSRHAARLADLLDVASALEAAVGPIEVVLGHNDLLASNFIDDGTRVWLVDWDYAGFNSPLFDLANLASNNDFDSDSEIWMLATYCGRAPDPKLLHAYRAMKCASLLRETMWSMVSEIHSTLDFDYASYTNDYLDRFLRAHSAFSKKRVGA